MSFLQRHHALSRRWALSLLVALSPLCMQTAAAAADTNQVDPYDAWWTGSLLSAYGRTLRPGHVVVEPYLIYSAPLKENPTHTLVPLIAAGAGITDAFDIQFILQGVFQAQGGASSTQIGDTSVRLGFQMLEDRHDGSWFPDLMFTVRETIPTGRYDQLDPNLRGTDASGSGAFTTSFGANVQKIFLPSNLHPLRMRLNLLFQFPSRASLQTGNVYPGKTVSALVSGEYHLTQQWVAALDLAYAHTTLAAAAAPDSDTAATVEGSNRDRFTVAPAIEYNFTPQSASSGGSLSMWAGTSPRR